MATTATKEEVQEFLFSCRAKLTSFWAPIGESQERRTSLEFGQQEDQLNVLCVSIELLWPTWSLPGAYLARARAQTHLSSDMAR